MSVCIGFIFTDSAFWAGSVIELPCPFRRIDVCLSVCMYVCAIVKTPTSRCPGNFWSKVVSLTLAFDLTISFSFSSSSTFFLFFQVFGFFSQSSVDKPTVIQPTVYNGGISRGRVCACGCWC